MEEADKGWLMTTICVSGWMFLLVPAHPDCPGQNPESCKMAAVVVILQNMYIKKWNYDKAPVPLFASSISSMYQLTLSRRLASANHSTILSAIHNGELRKVRYVNRKSSTYFVSTAEWSSTKCRMSFSGVAYVTTQYRNVRTTVQADFIYSSRKGNWQFNAKYQIHPHIQLGHTLANNIMVKHQACNITNKSSPK